MGQKVHPIGIRLGIVKDHASVWYADSKDYADYLNADLEVRAYLLDKLKNASVSRVEIARPAQTARITIHTARPGIVIGKKGEDVEKLRQDLTKKMGVPLHTLRADIDYATYEAHTTYGVIGVKVWIFKGEVIGGRHEEAKPEAPARKKAAR